MHRLIPRHHRKAGSGPPADALIAWIGTDPYLRSAVAIAHLRRRAALPSPADTRSARVAIVACFLLACGAVLGITTTVNDGAGLLPEPTPGTVLEQGDTTEPAQETVPAFSEQTGPDPVVFPTPAAMALPQPNRRALQPPPVPPADEQIDVRTDDGGPPKGRIRPDVIGLPARPSPLPARPSPQRSPDEPSGTGTRGTATRSEENSNPIAVDDSSGINGLSLPGNLDDPVQPDKTNKSVKPAGSDAPVRAGSPDNRPKPIDVGVGTGPENPRSDTTRGSTGGSGTIRPTTPNWMSDAKQKLSQSARESISGGRPGIGLGATLGQQPGSTSGVKTRSTTKNR